MATTIGKRRQMKACTSCAKLKIRCEFAPLGQKCNRCVRLGKECHNQAPGSHSKSDKRPRKNYDVEIRRLENMVKSMSELVASQTQGTATSPLTSQSSPASNLPAVVTPEIDCDVFPFDKTEGSQCIKLFITEFAPMFPFVLIHPDTDPEELFREKPLLYTCLIMITCQNNIGRQTDLARAIGDEISRCLQRRERSLPILQGILLYVSWNHVHQQLGAVLTYVHLAMAMVAELRLGEEAQLKSKISAGALRSILKNEPSPARTLEERRAYLGVIWITSVINTCFISMATPRFNAYTDECCRIIETAKEHKNDDFLVELIRLQQTVDRVDRTVYRDALDINGEMTVPLSMVVSALQEEITMRTDFKSSDPVQVVLSRLARTMLQLHLCKLALEESYFPSHASHTTFRADLLVACLSTIEALLDTFCELPSLAILSLPYGFWGMVGHTIKLHSRLSDVKYGLWSPTIDSRRVFGRLAQKMEEANDAGQNVNPPRRMPEFYEQIVTILKNLAEAKPNKSGNESFLTGDILPEDDMMGGILFDLLDWA